MIEVSKMGSEIVPLLQGHGLRCEDVAVFAMTDMALDGPRADVCLVLTEKELLVITGYVRDEGRPGKKHARVFSETSCETYGSEKLKELKIEEYISTGRLTATFDSEPTELAAMTKTSLRDVRIFVKYASAKLEGREEEIDENDFKDDRFCPKCGRVMDISKSENLARCPKCGNRIDSPDREFCPKCGSMLRK